MKSKKKSNGYILQSRKQFDGEDLLWGDGTPFDSRSAWTWLVQAAAFADGTYHTRFAIDELNRGEFIASLRFLAEAWKWSKNKCARFLALLEKVGRITRQRAGQHGTVYLIINYETYQDPTIKGGTPRGTLVGTETGHRRDKVERSIKNNTTLVASDDDGYSVEFELLWKSYPKREGGQNKQGAFKAFNARLAEGITFEAMFEGVKRYSNYLIASAQIGTRYVKMASTFLGPDRHFAEEWSVAPLPPVKLEDTRKVAGVIPISRGPIQW